jgi:hypothetical protein
VSTHADEQLLSPGAHSSEQAPFEQTCPRGHTLAQSPQWLGSAFLSTQSLPQASNGAWQAVWQAPFSQLLVAPLFSGQTWPHEPQFCESPSRSMHTLPQVAYGASHTKLQLFLAQTGVAWGGALQLVWQPPQLSASVINVTQCASQTVSPSSHLSGGNGVIVLSSRRHWFFS